MKRKTCLLSFLKFGVEEEYMCACHSALSLSLYYSVGHWSSGCVTPAEFAMLGGNFAEHHVRVKSAGAACGRAKFMKGTPLSVSIT